MAAVYDGVHQTPDYQDEGVMFLSVENIATLTSQKFISREAFARDYPVYPKHGDVLMTRIGDIGTSNVVETDDKLAFYVSLALLKPFNVDSYYLDKSLQSPSAKMELYRRTLHIAFPKKINKNQIAEVMLPIPRSRQEQEQIGALFRDLDSLIILHQRKCQYRGLYGYLSWEQRELGESTSIKTGGSDLRDSVPDGRYPFFVRSDKVERSNRYLYDGEAILIPGEGRLGEIFHYINGKFDYHQRVYKISDFNGVAAKFVMYSMMRDFKKHALQNTAKATVDSIRLPTLTEFQFSLPKLEEQKKIGQYFTQIDSLITLHQ